MMHSNVICPTCGEIMHEIYNCKECGAVYCEHCQNSQCERLVDMDAVCGGEVIFTKQIIK